MALPLFRWAGSKRKLLPELISRVPSNFRTYIEPFSGSACLFFALRPSRAIVSDVNLELINAYIILRSHPVKLYRTIAAMPDTPEFYYHLRDEMTPKSFLDRAARFVYLNRYCFNGVYRTNRSGAFNVPRGTKYRALPTERQFRQLARALKPAQLISADFEAVAGLARRRDFVYLDPPYAKTNARCRGEYGWSSFNTSDIDRLSVCLDNLDQRGATFLLSYADCEEVSGIKERWPYRKIGVRRHVAGFGHHRMSVEEILVSNVG